MSHLRADEIHLADTALVLLESGDLPRVRRPEKDRIIAANPAGVVRRVAKLFGAVSGELPLSSARHITNPKVVSTNERSALAVGRHEFRRCPARLSSKLGSGASRFARVDRGAAPLRIRSADTTQRARRVYDDEIGSADPAAPVPEAFAAEPRRLDADSRDEGHHVVPQKALSASVVRRGNLRSLLRASGRTDHGKEYERREVSECSGAHSLS